MLLASERLLSTWSGGAKRARHDYDSNDHLLEEMLNDTYWSTCIHRLNAGDYIYVQDAANQRAILLVDEIEPKTRRVWISVDERREARPVTDDSGLTVRWRGPRGGMWCVVNRDSRIISAGYRTRRDAEVRLSQILEDRLPKPAAHEAAAL